MNLSVNSQNLARTSTYGSPSGDEKTDKTVRGKPGEYEVI